MDVYMNVFRIYTQTLAYMKTRTCFSNPADPDSERKVSKPYTSPCEACENVLEPV